MRLIISSNAVKKTCVTLEITNLLVLIITSTRREWIYIGNIVILHFKAGTSKLVATELHKCIT